MVEEHEKLKVMGRESLMLGKEQLDLRYLEQLATGNRPRHWGIFSNMQKSSTAAKQQILRH